MVDNQYLDLVIDVLRNGEDRDDRTGVGTKSVFGRQVRFNLNEGFPMLTTKRVYWKGVVAELLWFLAGDTNVDYLVKNNVHIWDEWADEQGDLGRVYGAQWRSFRGWHRKETEDGFETEMFEVDQITRLVEDLKNNPMSRRHLVVAFNPADADKCALPPCHSFFQFYVSMDRKLSCQFYMRSNDVFLGLPFNIASYALLTHMIAHVLGYGVGDLIYTVGDCHIYQNHMEQVKLQLTRDAYELPTLKLNPEIENLFDFKLEDIELEGYKCHPSIKGAVAI